MILDYHCLECTQQSFDALFAWLDMQQAIQDLQQDVIDYLTTIPLP